MAEQLRMEAVVTDKFSGPLKRLQERLSGIREPEHLKELGEHFDRARERVEKLSEAMKVGLEPALSGVGIAGLTLGGTFAGLMQATRSFAETTATLSRLSNETGISIDRFREMDSVFGKLGVKAEVTNGAIKAFRESLHDIQRNRGAAFGWLTAQEPQLAKQLHDAKSPDEALGRAYGFLQRIPDPTERAAASQQLFGTSDMSRIGEMSRKELGDAIRDADKAQGSISEGGRKAAEDYETSTGKLRDALTGLRDDIGAKLLPTLNRFIVGVAGFVENHHTATIAGGVVASGGATVVATRLGRRLFRHWLGRSSHAAGSAASRVASEAAATEIPEAAAGSVAREVAEAATPSILGRALPYMAGASRFMGIVSAPLMLRDLGEAMNPTTPAGAPYRLDQLPGWAAKTEQARRSGEEFKRDPEAARGRSMLQRDLTEVHTNAVRDGAVEGLKKATPEAEKQVKGWFSWLWNSSADGGDTPFGAGGAKLFNASYEVGGSGIGMGTGSGGGSSAGSRGGSRRAGRGGSGGGGSGGSSAGPGTFDTSLPPEARAFLDDIASGEAPGYNVMNGGGRFSDMSHHPGGRAAGRYQDLPSTWGRISRALGLHDFSPGSQDKGNWWLAQSDYKSKTGRNLLADLKSGDPQRIAFIGRALHSTWVSTNGSFAGKYSRFLGGQPAGPSEASATGDFKLPKGGYWAKDSQGNPVAVGPDGAAIQSYRAPGDGIAGRMYPQGWKRVLDTNRTLTQGTGMGFLGAAQVNPEGNVTVNLHHFPSGVQAKTSADGFFKDVKVNRGRQMSEASQET